MATVAHWLRKLGLSGLWSRDRRRAARIEPEGMVAHYWHGAAPAPQPVHDISLNGLYVLTRDRWYRGTLVTMTLQQSGHTRPDRAITVQTQLVRTAQTGVGCRFIFAGGRDSSPKIGEPVDRLALKRFLERFPVLRRANG